MNSETLFDAITDVKDDFILEANTHRFASTRIAIKRWVALAASLAIVVGIGAYMLLRTGPLPFPGASTGGGGGGNAANRDGSSEFMSYSGPIFPLAVLGDATGLTASRDITFDFSEFGESRRAESGVYLHQDDIMVADIYTIESNTANDRTVSLLYPFAGSFFDLQKLLPVITSGGNALDAGLIAGAYSGGFTGVAPGDDRPLNLRYANSWEGFEALLSDGGYLRRTLGDVPTLSQTVTVYEFSNTWADHSKAVNPTLAASFYLDYERTTVLGYGFHGMSRDEGRGFMRQSFSVPQEWSPQYGRSFYLLVLGDDIRDLSIQGFQNGGCNPGEEMDEVSADFRRFEAVLGDMLEMLLMDFMDPISMHEHTGGDIAFYSEGFYYALLYRAVVELLSDFGRLSDNPILRYDTGWLEDILSEALHMSRVFYVATEVLIPAGGSVEIRVDMVKPGSYDFHGSRSGNTGVHGYGMMTRLGSDLEFSNASAGLIGTERIEIVRQNLGFDPANDILNVALNINVPHYYIEIRSAERSG